MFKEIYIIISPENGQLTQLLLQSDSRQVAMACTHGAFVVIGIYI